MDNPDTAPEDPHLYNKYARLLDRVTDEELFRTKTYSMQEKRTYRENHNGHTPCEDEIHAWTSEHFPDYEDPTAYWDRDTLTAQ